MFDVQPNSPKGLDTALKLELKKYQAAFKEAEESNNKSDWDYYEGAIHVLEHVIALNTHIIEIWSSNLYK